MSTIPERQKMVKNLKNYIGKTVTVKGWWYGARQNETAQLLRVTPFKYVEIKGQGIPFVGTGYAITSIEHDGKTIYDNQEIPDNYDARNNIDVDVYRLSSFGPVVAGRFRKEREKYEAERTKQKKVEKADVKKNAALFEDVFSPKTVVQLSAYLNELIGVNHTYDSSAKAISLALLATEHLMAEKLGTTGFQHGWAQLDFLGKTRGMKSGFYVIDYDKMLYPQYDALGEAKESMNETLQSPKFKETAQKLLNDSKNAATVVRQRWMDVVDGRYEV